jgi:3-methyladenine DNA glycosylase/8-oxoguanine DNA glycosylase
LAPIDWHYGGKDVDEAPREERETRLSDGHRSANSSTESHAPKASRRVFSASVDTRAVFALQQTGNVDPTAELSPTEFRKVFLQPSGLATVHRIRARSGEVEVIAESEDVTAKWQMVLSTDEEPPRVVREHPRLQRYLPHVPGLKLPRVPWLLDCAVSMVLQQRVKFGDAARSFALLATRFGSPVRALSPPRNWTLPAPKDLARIPLHDLLSIGIDPQRARTLLRLADAETRDSFLHDGTSLEQARQRLQAISGIGPWTSNMILGFGFGDHDAVPLGDVHLPHLICRVLAESSRGSDVQMQRLLEPFAGHRFYVIRLIWGIAFGPNKHLLPPHRG